MDGRLGFMIF